MLKKYLRNILIAIDEFFNTLAGGSPHESISARVGRNYPNTWFCKFINWLFFWQDSDHDHCEDCAEWEPEVFERDAIIK